MQTGNPQPRKKERRLLGCAIFAAPFLMVVGGIVGQWLAPSLQHGYQLLPPLSMPLALTGTFFLALPWARTQASVLRVAIGKAAGVAIVICLGWFLLGLAILFAMCGYRELSH